LNTAFANLIGFDGVQSGNGEVEIDFVGPAVPEPSTWAMLLLGFAGLGYAGYRHGARGACGSGVSQRKFKFERPSSAAFLRPLRRSLAS